MKRNVMAGAAVLAALGGVLVGLGERGGPPAGASAPAVADFHFRWPAGTEYVYGLEWASDHVTRLPLGDGAEEEEARFHADLAATLTLRSMGARGPNTVLALELSGLRRHEVNVLGQDVLPDRATAEANLVGQTAYLEVAPSGAVLALHFHPETQPLFRHLGSGILTSLHVELGVSHAPRWSTTSAGPLGPSDVQFSWAGAGAGDAPTLSRQRLRYAGRETRALHARAAIVLDPAGHVRSIVDREQASVGGGDSAAARATIATSLVLREVRHFTPPADLVALLDGTDSMRVGEARASGQAERQLLDQRVEGLTHERFLADLAAFANQGHLPDHNRWLWRATGLLKRDPRLAAQLVPLFAAQKLEPTGQDLVMDLLALAGTKESQAAMRTILTLPHVRADEQQYVGLLQRFSVVENIDATSAAFLGALYGMSGGGEDRQVWAASAYTLGAAAASLSKGGDEAAGKALGSRLVNDLGRAESPEQEGVLLAALGNAGFEENVATIVRHASDADVEVRMYAALALRKTHDRASRSTLLDLVSDADPRVQSAALTALGHHPLVDDDVVGLDAAVSSGGLHRRHDPQLLSILGAGVTKSPAYRHMLEQIIARNPDDAPLRARARAMLVAAQAA